MTTRSITTRTGPPSTAKPSKRLTISLLLSAVLLLAAALPIAVGTSPAAAAETAELVTTANNDAGWLIANNTRQWLSPQCRDSLEAQGASFDQTSWTEISRSAKSSTTRNCDQVANLYFADAPSNPPTPEGSGAWLVTVNNNDAGWLILDGTGQWLSPDCRNTLETEGAAFEYVAWTVIADTNEPNSNRSCDQVANLYFAPVPNTPVPPTPAPPTPTPVTPQNNARLVTINNNDAGWLILDGTSQWLSPTCRNTLEAQGATFDYVAWNVIAQTNEPNTNRNCDQIANLYLGTGPTTPVPPTPVTPTPGTNNGAARLSKGINFAGDLEVTPRGSWGTPIQNSFFPLVANAGFDHVRIPIRWSAYTGAAPAYRIQESFFNEVDNLVAQARAVDLTIVLDMHFFEELEANPWGERARFLAIWDQIARRYQNQPDSVVFELLNEPIGTFNTQPAIWNQLASEALAVVRQTNPTRTVIIGPVGYNHASRLPDLQLPNDPNIMATIHTYDPNEFTHQGAVFTNPVMPTGVTWRPNDATVALNWLDRSWGSDVTARPEGVRVNFQQQYGALAMVPDGPGQRYDELIISADRSTQAVVICNYEGGSPINLPITFNGGNARVNVSSCGPINSIALQSTTANSATITIDRMALCTNSCSEMIVTQYEALDIMISTAANWAADRGVGLYIGEFGVLSPNGTPTDPQSRSSWTNSIRQIAENNGVGWAYFELNGEFGIYNLGSGTWNQAMLQALLG